MGHFFTERDLRNNHPYDYNRQNDWFVGNINDYKFKLYWYVVNCDQQHFIISRREIRRWCERNLNGDVLVVKREKIIIADNSEHLIEWFEFCFEFEEDALAFKLRWDRANLSSEDLYS